MVAALGKTELSTSHSSGVGRVREHTIVIGSQVIAVDNIGTIQMWRGRRNWILALLGLFIAGGAATQIFTYQIPAYAGIGLGVLLILINLMLRGERGLSIGVCDGRSALIVSRDEAFLQRLMSFLVEKINTRSEALIGSFDIGNANISFADSALAARPRAEVGGVISDGEAEPVTTRRTTPPPPPPPVKPAATTSDETLFADSAAPAPAAPEPSHRTVIPPGPAVQMRVPPPPPRDPVLDGPSGRDDEGRDWLSSPGRIAYSGKSRGDGGGARWVLPILGLGLLGGGGFAAWMIMGQQGDATSPSFAVIPPPVDETAANETPATSTSMPEAPTPAATPVSAEVTPPSLTALAPATATPPAVTAIDLAAVTDFTPPEPLVSRTSGQRFRAQPSSADNVPILAETRSGGEPLEINGRSIQADGEWYRVALPQGRPAWFKASLAIPRARYSNTYAISTTPTSFPTSSPHPLEPAEGVQLAGGPQAVLLDWDSLVDANFYIVEIEAFDIDSQRWIDDPMYKRVTVDTATELSEAIPGAGAWRWRVRGVSPAGEQSQFSRWSAFGIGE